MPRYRKWNFATQICGIVPRRYQNPPDSRLAPRSMGRRGPSPMLSLCRSRSSCAGCRQRRLVLVGGCGERQQLLDATENAGVNILWLCYGCHGFDLSRAGSDGQPARPGTIAWADVCGIGHPFTSHHFAWWLALLKIGVPLCWRMESSAVKVAAHATATDLRILRAAPVCLITLRLVVAHPIKIRQPIRS
jgi:hypothetical protein